MAIDRDHLLAGKNSDARRDDALRILLQFHRAQESEDPYSFRFEPQEYLLPTAGGEAESASFEWTQELLSWLQALRLPGRDPALVQRIGERLRRFVKDAGWLQTEALIAQARAEQRPIFLTIRSSAAELYALPWELLTLKSGEFIGEVRGLLLRFEWPESESAQEQPAPRPEGGRILVAWSAAGGAVPAAEHLHAISAACAAGFHPFDLDQDVIANASLAHIVAKLADAQRAGPPIALLHLLCHGAALGSTFGLAFDGSEEPVVVDAMQLRQQLAPFASMVRLVVLSACDAGNIGALGNQLSSIAQALHRCGFAAVIASRFPLSAAGSIALTERFYGELLGRPASLESAFVAAREHLLRGETEVSPEERSLDWASLQLYARHSDGDDTRPVIFRPFRGLLAFLLEHRRFFRGRDAEVSAALSKMRALISQKQARFLVVAGASGTGKSSLVLAGVVPRLLELDPRLAFLSIRVGNDPELALDAALRKRPEGTPAVLVVDQFEEIFTLTETPAARATFVHRLWSLAQAAAADLRIIITLRVDYIGRCGELLLDETGLRLDRIAYAETHRVFIAQLQPEQLRAAIVEPARRVGLELQAGLAHRMLLEVGGEPGALPLLQDALDLLWQHREGRLLTQRAYDDYGGVIGALQRRADAIVGRLDKDHLAIVQRLLVSLVAIADDTALDTRLRVSLGELQHSVAADSEPLVRELVKELVAARLLVQDGDGESSRIEVAHEALIRKWPTLRTWLDEDRAGLLVQRRIKQAAQQWVQHPEDESRLYRGGQLAHASEWRKPREARLGELERRFLDASEALRERQAQQEAEREQREKAAEERLAEERRQKERHKLEAAQTLARRTLAAAVVMGVLLIGVLVVGAVAYEQSRQLTLSMLEAKRNAEAASQHAEEARKKSEEARQNALQAKRNAEEAKQNAAAARDGFLVAVAEANRRDPTLAGSILREVGNLDTSLWMQSAADALAAGLAEAVLFGHESAVQAVAYSPDGKKILTGSWDDTARIWNADSSGSPVVLKGHGDDVNAVAYSRDGKMIATGSWDKTVRIWRANGSGPIVALKGHTASIHSLAFSPDGTKLVTGSRDHTARIWNTDGSGVPLILEGHALDITAVAFSPDGKQVVTGSRDKTARVFNADATGTAIVLHGHEQPITSACFIADGKRVVTGSEDQTARIFRADGSGSPIVLRGHRASVQAVACSQDGKTIATGSADKTARLYNADGSGAPIVFRQHEGIIDSVAFRPDGKKIITGSQDQTVRIWDVEGSGSPTVHLGGTGISSIAFRADGKKMVIGYWDKSPMIVNADGSGKSVALQGHQDVVHSVAWCADGGRIVTGSADKTARIWSADGAGVPTVLAGHQDTLYDVACSPDGRQVATGSADKTARIWNADGSGAAVVLMGHERPVTAVAFSPDGRQVATGSADKTARIWNTDGSSRPIILSKHRDVIAEVAFSPNGQELATGGYDNMAYVWNSDGSGAPIELAGHKHDIRALAWSSDGRRLVTGSADKTVRIWNADGSGVPLILKMHDDTVSAVAFSRDGTRVVTGSADKTVRSSVVSSETLLARLWEASSYCLPVAKRRELLLESAEYASRNLASCQQEVLKRRAKK